MNLTKISEWMSSTKVAVLAAASLTGVAVVIAYLIHIEHLPKLSLLESVTSLGALGAFSVFTIVLFSVLTVLPVSVFVMLNFEIAEKISKDDLKLTGALIFLELLTLSTASWIWLSLAENTSPSLWYILALIVFLLILWSLIAKKYKKYLGSKSSEKVDYTFCVQIFLTPIVVSGLCILYAFLFSMINKVAGANAKQESVMLGIVIPSMILLLSPFLKGRAVTLLLFLGFLIAPFAFTLNLNAGFLLPKITVKMARQGSFFVDKIVLDKKGCQIVSDNPAQECLADTYYVCSAYVLSRIGDPHLIRVYTQLRNGTAYAKTFEIPSSSVIGLQMSELQPALEGPEVDTRLKENFKKCFAPQKYVLEGLFTLGDAALDDNSKRRLKHVVDTLLASGSMPLVHIHGYADDSGSKLLNSELSLKRAQAARDYLIEQGYRDGQILVSAEGADKPLTKCKEKPATEKYDCGRLNRRVEITAALQ